MTDERKPTRLTVHGRGATRAIVLHPEHGARERLSARSAASRLEEAKALAEAIALHVVHADIVTQRSVRPATYFGTGKVEEIGALMDALEAELVIVNSALTPVQQRNLERAWKTKVIDRTGLILEIFGERAQTREGRLQVELAHLTYQRSRLVRSWTHLERQRGGMGFLGGPGETQIEADRRVLAVRITRLKDELKAVTRTRGLQRRARKRVPYPVVALVGYTNAGKSTLFNALTKAEGLCRGSVCSRRSIPPCARFRCPGGLTAILSDTVGFISDLPTDLVAAFRATLEEVQRGRSHPPRARHLASRNRGSARGRACCARFSRPHRARAPRRASSKCGTRSTGSSRRGRSPIRARAERSGDAVAVSALTGVGLGCARKAQSRGN